MANKTIRQLANETGKSIEELCQILGKTSGSDTVTEDELRAAATRQPRRPRSQPQTQGTPSGNVMFTEVGQKVDQQLDPVALRFRLYAQQSLEQKVAQNICGLTSEEAIALLAEYDGDALGVQDNFDFFNQTAGHMDLSGCVQAIAPQMEQSKQLAGVAANQDLSTKSEMTSMSPSSEPEDSTPPQSGKGFGKS